MARIHFSKNRDAVAGVIEALLLVALVSVVLSTIQLIYVPQTMEQREADHMDEVENQFSFLKSVIDLQSMVGENVPISSPITLGSDELPYFVTARAFGQLDVIDESRTSSRITSDFISGITLTSIRYEAFNAYYIDQIYILEGGSVIVKQPDGETVIIEPSIKFENRSTEIRIYYSLPLIKGVEGKNSISGYKNQFIRTNYSSKTTYAGATTFIRIYTDYLDAWNDSFNKMLEEEINNGYILVRKYPLSSPQYVSITTGTKNLYLELAVNNIGAQIGPGYIFT
ncbi:MAG: hypothetical protein JXA91_05625 [Candidatus Thermoplasmatota archaeon]|nr:hypothetical protein [Candidatus Thermoplasmatota archaeon]